MAAGSGTSQAKGASAPKPFTKATGTDLRKLIEDYAADRGVEIESDATLEDIRELLGVDDPAILKVFRNGAFVDGEVYTDSDLSFAETIEMRSLIREVSGNEQAQIQDAQAFEFWPCLVTVVKRRTDGTYGLEKALALDFGALVRPNGDGPA